MIGERVGRYRLVGLIGEGGMGQVYEGEHEELPLRVAIKLLREEFSGDEKALRRFAQEARAISLLSHPGILQIHDHGRLGRRAYIVTERLHGESLRERLQRGPLCGAAALRVLRQAAAVLQVVHERQIVHRDIQPANLFLVRDAEVAAGERVKLLDFGIARFLDGAGRLTTTGQVLGTVAYLAPERCCLGGPLSGQADIYSLGIVFYEALCGGPPFRGAAAAVMTSHVEKEPPALPLPDGVGRLLRAMLAKQPGLRPTAAQVVERVRELEHQG